MVDARDDEREIGRRRRLWWRRSIALSLFFAGILGLLWHQKNTEEFNTDQLTSDARVVEYLEGLPGNDETRSELPTGVFVQSLRFLSSSDVHLTGYIWQRWSPELLERFEPGVVLPELVESSVDLRLEYDETAGVDRVLGWYFEGAFRQQFEFDDYPFDHKEVWIRLWPKNFAANLVLTPDFDAYPGGTGVDDRFGIDESIVLGEWRPDDTYFDYQVANYNTNFGIPSYVGQTDFPELRFNVLVRREFENAFIVNLVPLLVVAALAFGAVLTVTRRDDLSDRFGYNVSGVIATVSALFFVVLLSHIQLRQEFAGAGVTYLEYFYFVMYTVLMLVAVNAFMVSTRAHRESALNRLGDNMVAKLAYWPSLVGSAVVVTLFAF